MSTALRPRRPVWVLLTTIESEIDRAFDSASFRCRRCAKAGVSVWALGPPDAIAREAADHVLAAHGDNQAAADWARATLPAVNR